MAGFGVKTLIAAGALLGVPLAAACPSQAEVLSASIVVDANTGEVLHEQSADSPRHPASLTKMMTLYLVFEEIEQGRLSYATKLTVSPAATAVAPSKLELAAGEEIELIDAIKAVITKSANDMAVAIAERIGGTQYGFVRLMNERARQLGMKSTVFTNASGLPDERQITTARDMVTLALRLQDDFPTHYPLFALKSFDYRGKTYRTHNTLLYRFPGMDGIKTGYTRASGFNLVSSVRTGGKHLVAAVFGGATAAARNAHMRLLLFRALEKASAERTRQPGPQLVARPRPAPKTPADAVDTADAGAAWNTQTKEAAKTPRPVAAKRPPAPAPERASRPAAKNLDRLIADVTPGETAPAPAAEGDEGPAPAAPVADATVPKLDLKALRAAILESPSNTSGTTAPPADAPTAPASIDALLANPPAAAGPAREPSTLDLQAQALAAASADAAGAAFPGPAAMEEPAQEAAVPVRFDPAPRGEGYEIQIGAYASSAEAERKIASAKKQAPGLLEGHEPVALPVQKSDRQVFRARFTGFSEATATNACLELRRLAMDCFVMKAD